MDKILPNFIIEVTNTSRFETQFLDTCSYNIKKLKKIIQKFKYIWVYPPPPPPLNKFFGTFGIFLALLHG